MSKHLHVHRSQDVMVILHTYIYYCIGMYANAHQFKYISHIVFSKNDKQAILVSLPLHAHFLL